MVFKQFLKSKILLVCVGLIFGIISSTAIAHANCSKITPTKQGEVYFLRGLANIFSLGLDVMAKRVTEDGLKNCVFNHHHWNTLAGDLIARNSLGQISYPVIIVGHSLGANVAPLLATKLGAHNIPVSYVVMLDPVEAEPVGPNVNEVVNYYLPKHKETRIFAAEGFTGTIENINVHLRGGINHFNIDENPAIWDEIHHRIKELTDPEIMEMEAVTQAK
ncbi:MAG: hypothetical protein COC00_013750 [Rhizobiales bacterium]|nr:hypothetical protein [Hyphomicrobiales bacterium]